MKFYTGDFAEAKKASRNPKGSLGWSGSFIRYGIRLFFLYLYDGPLSSMAASSLADNIGFADGQGFDYLLDFEREIIEVAGGYRRDKGGDGRDGREAGDFCPV